MIVGCKAEELSAIAVDGPLNADGLGVRLPVDREPDWEEVVAVDQLRPICELLADQIGAAWVCVRELLHSSGSACRTGQSVVSNVAIARRAWCSSDMRRTTWTSSPSISHSTQSASIFGALPNSQNIGSSPCSATLSACSSSSRFSKLISLVLERRRHSLHLSDDIGPLTGWDPWRNGARRQPARPGRGGQARRGTGATSPWRTPIIAVDPGRYRAAFKAASGARTSVFAALSADSAPTCNCASHARGRRFETRRARRPKVPLWNLFRVLALLQCRSRRSVSPAPRPSGGRSVGPRN